VWLHFVKLHSSKRVRVGVDTNFLASSYDVTSRQLLPGDVSAHSITSHYAVAHYGAYRTVAFRVSAYRNSAYRNSAYRNSAYRNSAYKRQAANYTVCSCLTEVLSCLDASSCGRTPLADICNWAGARTFGGCVECQATIAGNFVRFMTAAQILQEISTLDSALVQYIEDSVSSISNLGFQFDFTTGTLTLSASLDSGVDATIPLNNVVFYLSKALDVLPGTVTYQLNSGKRQTALSASIVVVDEQTIADQYASISSASVPVVGVLAFAVLVLRFF